ncbi:MAG: glycosidase [Actinomycetota bacterium]
MHVVARRHPPVFTAADAPSDLGEDVVLTFNPGVVDLGRRLLMAYRADHGIEGDPHLTATSIGFAVSDDGVHWDSAGAPDAIDRQRALALLAPLEPHRDPEREFWRVYDPRLQRIEGLRWPLLMTLAVDTTSGLRPALLGSDDDGRTWTALELGLPDNRNVVLFPELIDGEVVRLERPGNDYGGSVMGAGRYSIWARRSADLQRWGGPRLVLRADELGAAATKIGPGAPPVRTDEGWLAIIHVTTEDPARQTGTARGWEQQWAKRYAAHAVLLDLDDPTRAIGWSSAPIIEPVDDHERRGYRHDVVFPGAVIVRAGDWAGESVTPTLWIYYGAADTVVGLAAIPLDDVLAAIDTGLDGARLRTDRGRRPS